MISFGKIQDIDRVFKSKTVLATITNSTKWYAPNVGVVKNEQYNNNNQLQYYTVLEVVK